MLEHLITPPTLFMTARRVALTSGASVLLHAAVLVLGVRVAMSARDSIAESKAAREVQFVALPTADKRPPPPPPMPVAQRTGAPVRAAPKYVPSRGQGPIVGESPAGFQELRVPEIVKGIPPVDITQRAVDTADFSGRGVIGGVGRGKVPEGPVARTAAEVARAGEALRFDTAAVALTPTAPTAAPQVAAPDPETFVYDIGEVTQPPVLLDPDAVRNLLLSLYPRSLRDAGVGGRVVAECIVGNDGAVEAQSIKIVETPHELFAAATELALAKFRFKPAQVRYRGKLVPVRMRVTFPIDWEVRRG